MLLFWLHKTISIDTDLFINTEIYDKYIHILNLNLSKDIFDSFFISRNKRFY